MDYDIAHAAERKAFQAALNLAFKKIDKNDETGYVDMVNLGQKVLGDTWPSMKSI